MDEVRRDWRDRPLRDLSQAELARSARELAAEFPIPPLEQRPKIVVGYARLYADTGDPFHAWTAYQLAQRWGCPVPRAVAAYLGRVADRMVDTILAEPKKLTRAAVLGALEMSGRGRGAVLSKRRQGEKDAQYAADVLALKRKGHNTENATYLVAKYHGVKPGAIGDAYRKFKALGRSFASISGHLRPSRGLPD